VVATRGCPDCHGGVHPAGQGWLAGKGGDEDAFQVDEHRAWARNLTPDNATGLGRFSERQIFNALRYGLRPGETPDVEITSTTPGEGNFPEIPKYLAPAMPWSYFRHMPDEDLWAVAAYLKRGVKPVNNRIPDSEGPPDFWASEYTLEKYGPYPLAPFPTANEVSQEAEEPREEYVSTAKQDIVLHDDLKAVPGSEAYVLAVEFPAGWVGERHYHTGDVFVYVLEGEFVVDVEGEGRLTFGPGEVYHESLNTVMQARNPRTDVATKAILFQVGKEGEPLMIRAE
jgi:quercetin dioxygenase-like cupin family protein